MRYQQQEALMSTISLTPTGSFSARHDRPAAIVADRPTRSRLRLTARGRAVLLLLLAAPIAVWLLLAQLNGGAAAGTRDAGAPVPVVVVQPGESLWSIAEQVAPNADPRDVIDAIVSFNHLPSADVVPGEQLGVPAPYSGT